MCWYFSTIHCPKFLLLPLFSWFFNNHSIICVQNTLIEKKARLPVLKRVSTASGFNTQPERSLRWLCIATAMMITLLKICKILRVTSVWKKMLTFYFKSLRKNLWISKWRNDNFFDKDIFDVSLSIAFHSQVCAFVIKKMFKCDWKKNMRQTENMRLKWLC